MKALTQSFIKIRKMGKILFLFVVVLGVFGSCTTEKINLSPISNLEQNNKYQNTNFSERTDLINYSSEITNLTSTIPKFSSDAVNKEIGNLKYYLKDYIGGLEVYNFVGMEKAHKNYQKSYKKLQGLKSYLKKDEAEVLNRYLVRIKTNMNTLESQQKKGTITTNQ